MPAVPSGAYRRYALVYDLVWRAAPYDRFVDLCLEAAAAHGAGVRRVRAVGETGLDFYRTPDEAGKARQREAFAAHIAMARPTALPTPWPSGPVEASTPAVRWLSGCPGVRLPHCRKRLS